MKSMFLILAATALVAVAPSRCFALWGIATVSKEEAKALGMEVRSKIVANQVRVELMIKIEGALKAFNGVELRVGRGNNAPLTAPLREDRSTPGSVVVSFTADRDDLHKLSLWVRVPELTGGTIYDIRIKDFVDLPKER